MVCCYMLIGLTTKIGSPKATHKLLKDPSTKEFFDIFKFLIALLDPQMEVEGKIEDEVPPS